MTTDLKEAVKTALDIHDDLLRAAPDHSNAGGITSKAEEAAKKVKLPDGSMDEIIRPNGEAYKPRMLTAIGTTDVAFIKLAYDNRIPVLLYGPPGTGKTALLEAALPGIVTLMGTAETETSDFIGSYVQRPDGMYEWVDGPLVVAMEAGIAMLVDEIALIDARVMSVAYSVMDGRKELPITANPARGTVTAKEGFVVYGSCNPNVPGAVMSDALLSRFGLHVEVFSDWSLAKMLGCGTKVVSAAMNLNAKLENHELTAAPQLRELLTFTQIAGIYGEPVAVRNLLGSARIEDRATYAEVLRATFGDVHDALRF
jgi:hypothetical protein